MTRVCLPAAILRDMLDHARHVAPDECCGPLIGSIHGADEPSEASDTSVCVVSSVPARNLRRSPTRYLVDPADHFAAIRTARQDRRTVIGAYHSHPTSPPAASATDTREASGAEFLYLIVSPVTGTVKAFRPSAGRLRELPLQIVPDALTRLGS